MIPRAYIYEWQKYAPWQSNAQIEQDLVIERALVELFSNDMIRENLAFRGGTALHKIFLKPQVRYSEDIDLVQIKPGSIHPVMQEIKKALSFLGIKRNTKQNLRMNTMVYRFDTEIAPVINSRLKIEINCRDLFDLYYSLINQNPDCDKITYCLKKYMKLYNVSALKSKELLMNLDEKMQDNDFLGDIKALLRPGISYDVNHAYELVRTELIERL